ncbi:hypothetical protein SDC9_27267 [bioreactor metagenome]|uniref:HTH marR-type domain-containing protein n=1 Tax=bioreactor metagenome TaxID=1076179 RepID=A0A644UQN5_9ZZZZ|nr:MarR family transcriptional regulator [Desulfovibrio desulfuricans]MEA4991618.1 MarR family transcriptional regulator [Desulfovibrio desulfuricans]
MSTSRKYADGEALHTLFRQVFALQSALAVTMDEVHEKAGLGTPQVKVMDLLQRHGTATVPEIAGGLSVSRQFVQTVCNGLEAKGLIAFSDNPRHVRSRLASLTASGQKVFASFRQAEAAFIESKLQHFDSVEVAEATALLCNLCSCMECLRRKKSSR